MLGESTLCVYVQDVDTVEFFKYKRARSLNCRMFNVVNVKSFMKNIFFMEKWGCMHNFLLPSCNSVPMYLICNQVKIIIIKLNRRLKKIRYLPTSRFYYILVSNFEIVNIKTRIIPFIFYDK